MTATFFNSGDTLGGGTLWSSPQAQFDPATNPDACFTADTHYVPGPSGDTCGDILATQIGSLRGLGHEFTGIAVDPTDGQMYGVTSNIDVNPRTLYRINKAAGTTTLVAALTYDFGTLRAMPDITFNSAGQMYGIAVRQSSSDVSLATVNKATGAAHRIGSTGKFNQGGNGLACHPTNGTMYWASGNLYVLSTTTGAVTSDRGELTLGAGDSDFGHIGVFDFASLAWTPDGADLYTGFSNGFFVGVITPANALVRCIAENGLPSASTAFDAICWDGTGGPPKFPPPASLTYGDTYFRIEGVGRGAGAVGGGGGGSISGGGGGSTGGGTGGTTGGTGGGPGGGPPGGGGGTPTGAGVGTIRWGGSYVLGTPGYTDMDVFNVDLNRLTAPAELPGQVVFYRSACSVHTAYDSSIPVGSASLLRDSGGNLIVNSQFSQPGDQCYILDVSDPAMSTALGNACVNWCSTYNFDGIWMDDVVFWATSLVNALPAGWSQAQWASRLSAHVRRVAKIIRDAGYQIACNSNGFIPGDSPASDNGDNELVWWTTLITPAAANELSPTGLTPEYWMQSPGNITQVRTKGAAFYQFWDGWRRLHPFCHTNGIDFIPVSYATADDDACIYIRATQLLDFNGTGVLYSGTETAVPYGPIWCKDPGAPTSAATEISSGVWRRTFANTTVTVDTNSGFATIT